MKKKVWIGAVIAAIVAGVFMGCISISFSKVPPKPEDASATGSVSFTNIPEEYNTKAGSAWVGDTVSTLGIMVRGYEMNAGASINGGAFTVPLWAQVEEEEKITGWAPFTETVAKDVLLRIDLGVNSSGVGSSGHVDVLFKAVPFENGKAVLDFANGTKQ